jgi:hypothetical protein
MSDRIRTKIVRTRRGTRIPASPQPLPVSEFAFRAPFPRAWQRFLPNPGSSAGWSKDRAPRRRQAAAMPAAQVSQTRIAETPLRFAHRGGHKIDDGAEGLGPMPVHGSAHERIGPRSNAGKGQLAAVRMPSRLRPDATERSAPFTTPLAAGATKNRRWLERGFGTRITRFYPGSNPDCRRAKCRALDKKSTADQAPRPSAERSAFGSRADTALRNRYAMTANWMSMPQIMTHIASSPSHSA